MRSRFKVKYWLRQSQVAAATFCHAVEMTLFQASNREIGLPQSCDCSEEELSLTEPHFVKRGCLLCVEFRTHRPRRGRFTALPHSRWADFSDLPGDCHTVKAVGDAQTHTIQCATFSGHFSNGVAALEMGPL